MNELSKVLDEIEERARIGVDKLSGSIPREVCIALCKDNPALVKALRKAVGVALSNTNGCQNSIV